jgi:hypothetical protein
MLLGDSGAVYKCSELMNMLYEMDVKWVAFPENFDHRPVKC